MLLVKPAKNATQPTTGLSTLVQSTQHQHACYWSITYYLPKHLCPWGINVWESVCTDWLSPCWAFNCSSVLNRAGALDIDWMNTLVNTIPQSPPAVLHAVFVVNTIAQSPSTVLHTISMHAVFVVNTTAVSICCSAYSFCSKYYGTVSTYCSASSFCSKYHSTISPSTVLHTTSISVT